MVSIGPRKDLGVITHRHYFDRVCLSGLLFPESLCVLHQRGLGVRTLH